MRRVLSFVARGRLEFIGTGRGNESRVDGDSLPRPLHPNLRPVAEWEFPRSCHSFLKPTRLGTGSLTIEFSCKFCGKILRTADDKAGRQAKCPSCGEAIMVPAPDDDQGDDAAAAPSKPASSKSSVSKSKAKKRPSPKSGTARSKARDYVDDYEDEYDDYHEYEDDYDDGYDDDYDEPPKSKSRSKPCPVCGGPTSPRDDDCPHCGEDLYAARQVSRSRTKSKSKGKKRSSSRSSRRDYTAGEIIGDAWVIFQDEMGSMIGGMLITGMMMGALYFVTYLTTVMIGFGGMFAIFAAGGGNPGPEAGVGLGIVAVLAVVVFFTIFSVGVSFIQVGHGLFVFNAVTGKGSDISDLFRGGKYLVRYFLATFVFMLMSVIGSILLFIPGVIVSIMFGPYMFALIDRDGSGLQCLSDAKEATDGHWMTILVLGLAIFGINLGGALLCGLGTLFTAPLSITIMAVAYCRMAGVRVDV